MMRVIYSLKWKSASVSLNVPFVKLFSKYIFQCCLSLLMPFCFGSLIKGKDIPILLFINKNGPRIWDDWKFTKEQETNGYLGFKISAKIKIYTLARAHLRCPLCNEIPCNLT